MDMDIRAMVRSTMATQTLRATLLATQPRTTRMVSTDLRMVMVINNKARLGEDSTKLRTSTRFKLQVHMSSLPTPIEESLPTTVSPTPLLLLTIHRTWQLPQSSITTKAVETLSITTRLRMVVRFKLLRE